MHKRRSFIFALIPFLILISGFAFFQYSQTQRPQNPTSLAFNPTSGKWEEVANTPRIELQEVDPDPNEDGLHNRTVVRGFFDHLNIETNELSLKMALPFTAEMQYQHATFKLAPNQQVYCSPSMITDRVSGKSYPTRNLGFIVKNGQTMHISQEQNLPFEQFAVAANDDTYVFLQLTQEYREGGDNYIQKMVVLGVCD